MYVERQGLKTAQSYSNIRVQGDKNEPAKKIEKGLPMRQEKNQECGVLKTK